jgi:hypothetical protein
METTNTAKQTFYQIKEQIQQKAIQLDFQQEKSKLQELLEFIFEIKSDALVCPQCSTSLPTSLPAAKPVSKPKPPVHEDRRCVAKLANGSQCSRARSNTPSGEILCGFHKKANPYGFFHTCNGMTAATGAGSVPNGVATITKQNGNTGSGGGSGSNTDASTSSDATNVRSQGNSQKKQIHEVFAVEIHGLVYYIDTLGNVFRTEDIMNSVMNPQVIAKCIKVDNRYIIPSLGLM